jgi:hypothetical protein
VALMKIVPKTRGIMLRMVSQYVSFPGVRSRLEHQLRPVNLIQYPP